MEVRVVIIGGDREKVDCIKASLNGLYPNGVQFQTARSKEHGLACVEQGNQDLIVVCPPGLDGNITSAIVDLRRITETPVVYIGDDNGDREVDVCTALLNGADGYVILPCGPKELRARLFAVMRRNNDQIDPKNGNRLVKLDIDGFIIDPKTYGVSWNEKDMGLTRTEFDLLYLLARNKDQVVVMESIWKKIWPERTYRNGCDSIKKYVQRLRKKLGDDGTDHRWIINLHGKGYQFIGPPANTAV